MMRKTKRNSVDKKSNKVCQEKPYWQDAGYSINEWKHRQWFENKYSNEDTYNGFVSDLDELEI